MSTSATVCVRCLQPIADRSTYIPGALGPLHPWCWEASQRLNARDLEAALREAREEIAIQRCHYAVSTVAWERSGKLLDRIDAALSTASVEASRACTCHPDDNPPRPCPQKYAYSECVSAASGEASGDECCENGKFGDGHTCMKQPAPSEAPNAKRARQIALRLIFGHVEADVKDDDSFLVTVNQIAFPVAQALDAAEARGRASSARQFGELIDEIEAALRDRIAELEKERDDSRIREAKLFQQKIQLEKALDSARAEGIAAERERIAKWFEDKQIEESGVDWGLSDHDERQSIKDHNRRVMGYAAAIREAKP